MKRRMTDRGDGVLIEELPFVGLGTALLDIEPLSTATQLATGACRSGLLLQASTANTVSVRFGGADVDATHGGWLAPGQMFFIRCSDSGQVYVSCATVSQKVGGFRL